MVNIHGERRRTFKDPKVGGGGGGEDQVGGTLRRRVDTRALR